MSGSQKEGIGKKNGGAGEGAGSLKSPGSHFNWFEKGLQQQGELQQNGFPPLWQHICDQKHPSAIQHRSLVFIRQGPFCPTLAPASCVQASPGTHAQLPAMWLRVAHGCKELKLTTVYLPNLPWKLQTFNIFQSSKIVLSDRFCQCNYCLGE